MTKKILSFVVLASLTIAANAQKITLKLAQGQKITSTVNSSSNVNIEVMGQTQEQNSNTVTTSVLEVKTVAANEIAGDITMTNVKMTGSGMGREVSYDSDKKDNDSELAELMGGEINKAVAIKVDAKGEEIKDEKAAEKKEKAGMAALTGGDMGIKGIILPSLFDQEIKQGTTWTTTTEKKAATTTKTENHFTIDKVENDIIHVTNNAVQKIDGVMEQMGMEMPISGTNTVKATIQIDAKTGLIKKMTSEINGTSTVTAQGMEIPVTTKVVISVQNQ